MRFVAILNQHQVPHTLGFRSSVKTLDFLFCGYEDQRLLPYGLYDKVTDQATVYTQAGQLIHDIAEESIRTTAKKHLAMSHLPALIQPFQGNLTTYENLSAMNHPVLKVTISNIISLWFGADTSIRQYKIRLNPELWAACQRVHGRFIPPSGASSLEQYRQSDRVAFAKVVAQEVNQEPVYFT